MEPRIPQSVCREARRYRAVDALEDVSWGIQIGSLFQEFCHSKLDIKCRAMPLYFAVLGVIIGYASAPKVTICPN